MKNHDEMYQSVLSRFDEYQKQKKKRLRIIKLATPAVACFGLAIAFGIGYYAKFAKLPEVSVTPPVSEASVAETSVTETTTTTVASVTDSSTVSPSDTRKSEKTDKKTVPTTVSGYDEQTKQPPSHEVYPPRLIVTTAPNTSSGSKTVHTTVSHRVTERVSVAATTKQTSKRTTAAETTVQTSVSRQSTDAPIPENTTATTTTAVTAITLSPARKTVKEYSIIFSAEADYDYDSILDKSYAEFVYSGKDEIETVFPADAALEEVEQAEARSGGRYPRQRAVILGEIPSYAQRLTYDRFMEILHDPNVLYSGYHYGKMKQAIEEIQPYPDFVCEGEHRFTEYWFNNAGTEKIVFVPEMSAAVYVVLGD